MSKLGIIKAAAIQIREKVAQFKDDHKMASSAISQIIDELPFPFKLFGKIIWDGLEKEENGGAEFAKMLQRISETSEEEFAYIDIRLSGLMQSVEESKEIGKKILNSNESVLDILGSSLRRLEETTVRTDQNVVEVLKLLKLRKVDIPKSDYDIFLDYRVVFDRPAFKAPYRHDSSIPSYIQAIHDTINAIDTGLLLTRSGTEITKTSPKSSIKNEKWRKTMEVIETNLSEIIQLQNRAPSDNLENSRELWAKYYQDNDAIRDKIIRSLNQIWGVLGIPPLPIPSETKPWEETLLSE